MTTKWGKINDSNDNVIWSPQHARLQKLVMMIQDNQN